MAMLHEKPLVDRAPNDGDQALIEHRFDQHSAVGISGLMRIQNAWPDGKSFARVSLREQIGLPLGDLRAGGALVRWKWVGEGFDIRPELPTVAKYIRARAAAQGA